MAKAGSRRYDRKQAVLKAGKMYAADKSLEEIAKELGRTTRTVRKYLAEIKAISTFEGKSAIEFRDCLLDRLLVLEREAKEFLAEAKKAKDKVARGIAIDKGLGVINSMTMLLAKSGTFEGDKASVTVNILSMKEEDAYRLVERSLENPEMAQALCNLLAARGYKPQEVIEGDYEVVDDGE
jgi:predicted transcriptional regulator